MSAYKKATLDIYSEQQTLWIGAYLQGTSLNLLSEVALLLFVPYRAVHRHSPLP